MVYFDTVKKRSIVSLSNTNLEYWLRPELVRNINNYLDQGRIMEWERPEPEYLKNTEITGNFLKIKIWTQS